MKKTYLFDFDGTLVDSMPTYVRVMLKILDENGIVYSNDLIKIITPLGAKGTWEYFQKLGLKLSFEAFMKNVQAYALCEYADNIPAKNNVAETLRTLKEAGHSLNVLTASPHVTLDPCLKRLGLFDLFDNVWSCDDFNTTKTNPEIYIRAAEKLGVAIGDLIFIDDNYNADKTAKEAGAIVYGIYDESSKEFIDEMKSITDAYVYDFKELLDI